MRNKAKDEAEKAQRMQRVMEVAFGLFAERGIDRVTMPEVAEASGVARPSLYRYFSSKTDLVIAIGTWKWQEYDKWHRTTLSQEEMVVRVTCTAAASSSWVRPAALRAEASCSAKSAMLNHPLRAEAPVISGIR